MIAVTQSDGFAISMLVMLVVSFSAVAMILLMVLRNNSRTSSPEEELIEDSLKDGDGTETKSSTPAGEKEAETRLPWERDSDWWKQ